MLDPLRPTPEPPRLLLSARDAAKALSISERTLWTRTKAGEIPVVRIGQRVLYSIESLRQYIARKEGAAR